MKERQIFRVKYFSANKPLKILRRGKKKTIDLVKSFKCAVVNFIAFFKSEPKRNHPKFHFSFMRLRSATILTLIGLMLASFLSFAGGGIFAGVSNSWVIAPDTQLGTATVSDLQSTGYGAVELERSFNKTMDDVRIPYDRSTRRQQYPRSITTADGNMYVVWHEVNGNEVGIQKFNSTGVRQWQYDKLAFGSACAQPTGTFSNVTAIAAYGNDVIVVSGCHNAVTGFNEIYAQRLNSSGVRQWVPEVRVNDNTTRNKIDPEVAVIGSNIFVAWSDERTLAGTYQLYAQTLDLSGNITIAGDQALVTPGVNLVGPYLNKTSSDKLLLTYANSADNNMYGIQYNTSWVPEWGPNQIGWLRLAPSVSKGQIATTVIGDNSYHFFRANYAVNLRVWGQALDSSGNKLWNGGADLRVGFTVLPSRIQSWNDGTNPYFGVSEFSGAPDDRPYGKKVKAADGTVLWGGKDDPEPPLAVGPNVAPHQLNFWVTYNNGYNYVFYDRLPAATTYFEDIYYNRFDTNNNNNYPADLLVNQDFEYADQDVVNLVKDGGGNIFATWRDSVFPGINDHIHANLFNSSGVRQWANDTTVNSSGVDP
ncbi:MAG: hypothetical protein NT039_03140, partial [Candidatus Berkelbacteria bacterium]|nr:hypothetical protein [Candidatus Berkelbacteria bacterium]